MKRTSSLRESGASSRATRLAPRNIRRAIREAEDDEDENEEIEVEDDDVEDETDMSEAIDQYYELKAQVEELGKALGVDEDEEGSDDDDGADDDGDDAGDDDFDDEFFESRKVVRQRLNADKSKSEGRNKRVAEAKARIADREKNKRLAEAKKAIREAQNGKRSARRNPDFTGRRPQDPRFTGRRPMRNR